MADKRPLRENDFDFFNGRFTGLAPVGWTPSKGAIMRWEVCNENEKKAIQRGVQA